MWFLLGNYHLISFACQGICWYMTYGHSAKIQEIQESLPLKPSVKEQQFLFCLGKRYEIGLKLREKYAWKVQGVVNSFWDLSPAMTLGPLGGRNINLFVLEIQTTCTSCVEVKLNCSLLFFKAALPIPCDAPFLRLEIILLQNHNEISILWRCD